MDTKIIAQLNNLLDELNLDFVYTIDNNKIKIIIYMDK